MVKIERSFDDLQQRIREFNAELANTQSELIELSNALTLDPGNVDLITDRYSVFAQQLQASQANVALLREEINALNEDYNNGLISQDNYNSQLAKLESQATLAEIAVSRLTGTIEQSNNIMENTSFDALANSASSAVNKLNAVNDALNSVKNNSQALYSVMTADWGNASWFERAMLTIESAIVAVNIALAIAKVVSAGLGAPAVAGAIISGVAAVAIGVGGALTAGKQASGGSSAVDSVTSATKNAAENSNNKTIDINVRLESQGDTLIDQSNAMMISTVLQAQLKKDLVPYLNEAFGATNR